MQVYDEANMLARQIRESEVCMNYRQMKEEIDADETLKLSHLLRSFPSLGCFGSVCYSANRIMNAISRE